MKKSHFLLFSLCAICLCHPAFAGKINKDCTYKGRFLAGHVQIVQDNADFRVLVTSANPDIRIQIVDFSPDSCGKWKLVDMYPDFTVQFDDVSPDFTIVHVDDLPGVP